MTLPPGLLSGGLLDMGAESTRAAATHARGRGCAALPHQAARPAGRCGGEVATGARTGGTRASGPSNQGSVLLRVEAQSGTVDELSSRVQQSRLRGHAPPHVAPKRFRARLEASRASRALEFRRNAVLE